MYVPGSGVTLYIDLQNAAATNFSGSTEVVISHLGAVVTNLPAQSISSLPPNGTTTKVYSWLPPMTNYQGYLIQISIKNLAGAVVDSGSSAIDVSSDWAKFPRYGYVAHFDAGLDAYNAVWQLKNYHINGLQFYDWQWKHHIPYSPAASWSDIANRAISRATVTNLINAAHIYGMMAMNYNLYGGAYSNYLSDGSGVALSMGIFSGPKPGGGYTLNEQLGHPLGTWAATLKIFTMNNRDTNWQNYIFGREQGVFSNFAFDGWHIDSLGQSSVWDYDGTNFSLHDHYPQFINNAKAALNKRMVYNSVDAGGESQVAQSANVDFIYSELWSGNANYIDFKTRVDNVRRYGSKAVVFPAYMNYAKTSGSFNEASVRLTDAAIFACGASHLELGDGGEMLRTEYFPENTVKMSVALKAVLRTYYDFLVGYQNLLRDGTVSANNAVGITGVTTSTNGAAGSVWVISKKKLGFNIVHFINLLNNTSTAWRDDNGTYPAPTTRTNLAVKMYYSGAISGGKLWWATPDTNAGAATQLSFTTGSDGGGNYVNFTLPQLQYWDMVWLELNGTNSAAAQIQAENYNSMAGIGTETTADTGGGLNVGFVNNVTGDSYVAFNKVDFGAGAASVSARVASAIAGSSVEFHLGSPMGPLIATVSVGNTGGWQNWQTINAPVSGAAGVHDLFVVFKNAAANLNWFAFSVPLPSPWVTADIGAVGVAGGASISSGTFTLNGSGADIEGVADAFRYVYQSSSGEGELRARVLSVQNTDPWAKAGVMIRESAATNAMNAAVVVTPSNGVSFQRRASVGGGTTSTVIAGATTPEWVRLVRTATNSFAGYYSADGTNWTQIGSSINIPMSSSAVAGLAVTAHNNAALNTATFDNVSINHPPMLSAISNRTVLAGVTLTLTNSATDADVPLQPLTFNLLAPPVGAGINTNTGVFAWRPAIAQSPSTQTLVVVVSDSGVPSMSATQNFAVTVTRPVAPSLSSASATNGQFGFWINGDAGPDYIIEASTNLSAWTTISATSSPPMPYLWADSNLIAFPVRFYRALLGP